MLVHRNHHAGKRGDNLHRLPARGALAPLKTQSSPETRHGHSASSKESHRDRQCNTPRQRKQDKNKAFRYDDHFQDTYYPKNGWGCECYVTIESEYETRNNGREVFSSGEDGEESDIPGVDRDKFDPTWKYNSGREAPAPNFNRYEHPPEDMMEAFYATYRAVLDSSRLSKGGFTTLLRRTNEADYKPLRVRYQAGNLEEKRFAAMRQAGVTDSKIITTDSDLYHGTGNKRRKVISQRIGENPEKN
jgi:hypothetical protein